MIYSAEAEQAIIGTVLLEPDLFNRLDKLSSHDFGIDSHKLIWEAIEILGDKTDLVHLSEVLTKQDKLELVGGTNYLMDLTESAMGVSPSAVFEYIGILKEYTVKRDLRAASLNTLDMIDNKTNGASVALDYAQTAFLNIGNTENEKNGLKLLGTTLKGTIGEIQKRYEMGSDIIGLATGFTDIDKRTHGYQSGNFVVIAARPSMGKTTLALNMALNVAKNGGKVQIFSLEMNRNEVTEKLLAQAANLPLAAIKKPKNLDSNDGWSKLTAGVNILNGLNIEIDDSTSLTPTQLKNRSKRHAQKNGGVDFILVDYIQLMEVGDDRVKGVGDASRAMKVLASELECPVIALSQLNRGVENRNDKRPMMSDLRESGAIEQDANIIHFIYRDEVYNENTDQKGLAQIITAKNRSGETGTDYLSTNLANSTFNNIAYGYQEPQRVENTL